MIKIQTKLIILLIILISYIYSVNAQEQVFEGTLVAMYGPEKIYYFLTTLEKTYKLVYEQKIPADLIGKTVSVTGTLTNRTIYISSIIAIGPGAPEFQPIVVGPQKTVVMSMKYLFYPSEPFTLSYLQNLIFGPFPSLKTLWQENSYNSLSIVNNGTYGWWTLPYPEIYYNPPFFDPLFDKLVEDSLVIAYSSGVQFLNYTRLILFFNGIVGNADGWGSGYRTYQTIYGPLILSVSWMPFPGGYSVGVNGQEYGHQLGFLHSGNVYYIYDSPWDVMSDAYQCTTQGQHTIIDNKISAGWITGTNGIVVPYTSYFEDIIYPTTKSSGLRGIIITTPDSNITYTVEVRKQENHDSCLPNSGVIIHKVNASLDDWKAKPIDANPSTTGFNGLDDAHWQVGQIYNDPVYNFSIQIVSNQPNDGKLIRVIPPNTGTALTSCGTINSPGSYYLANNVSSYNACFYITANNVVLDCQGNTITHSSSGGTLSYSAIVATNARNIAIKSCNIFHDQQAASVAGILLVNVSDSYIINNTINATHYSAGVYILPSLLGAIGINNTIVSNKIYINLDTYGVGMVLFSPGSLIANNIINSITGYNIRLDGYTISDYFYSFQNNTGNGKPILYYKNLNNQIIDLLGQDASHMIVVNSINATFRNANILGDGIIFYYVNNSLLENSNYSTSKDSIQLIYLRYSHENTILNNSFLVGGVNSKGLAIIYSLKNKIVSNKILTTGNYSDAIFLESPSNEVNFNTFNISGFGGSAIAVASDNNTIFSNTINSVGNGIYTDPVTYGAFHFNKIISNNISARSGIDLFGGNNLFVDNVISSTVCGMCITGGSGTLLRNSITVTGNSTNYLLVRGISLIGGDDNQVINNTIKTYGNSSIAIFLFSIRKTTFYFNKIFTYGENSFAFDNYFTDSNNIVNNVISTTSPAPIIFSYLVNSSNYWNTSLQAGPNIIGGPYLGGNYYARTNGLGYSQTCIDNNFDGICDAPLVHAPNNTDYLPLTRPPPTLTYFGSPNIGNTVTFSLLDSWNPSAFYILLLSLGNSTGILLSDGRIIPINPDVLFDLSLIAPSALGLTNSVGYLNNGNATAYWTIPNIPSISGTTVYADLITLDLSQPMPQTVSGISAPIAITLI